MNVKDTVDQWLNGEISMAKMLQEFRIERQQGEVLVGAFWQCFYERTKRLDDFLAAEIIRSERDFADAMKETDKAAESTRRLAYVRLRSQLRLHLLGDLERTMAAI